MARRFQERKVERETESTWITRALAGDEEAFGILYRTYRARVRATVARYVSDRDEREDLAQEIFTRAFLGLAGFRGRSAFATWLTSIAIHACVTHLRTRQAHQNRMDRLAATDAAAEIHDRQARVEDPEAAVAQRERRELVRAGIRRLPEAHRKAVWLRYMQERSYEEMGRELRVPVGTVKIWLHRGKRRLAGELRKLGAALL